MGVTVKNGGLPFFPAFSDIKNQTTKQIQKKQTKRKSVFHRQKKEEKRKKQTYIRRRQEWNGNTNQTPKSIYNSNIQHLSVKRYHLSVIEHN